MIFWFACPVAKPEGFVVLGSPFLSFMLVFLNERKRVYLPAEALAQAGKQLTPA